MSVLDRTVREIMETDVVTVRPELPIKGLIEVLDENGITGAPVADEEGNVVGVVSTTDVTRLAAEQEESGEGERSGDSDPQSDYFRRTGRPDDFFPALPPGLPKTRLGTRPVREAMTRATFSVRPEATLPEAARFLHEAGIHRALVFDGGRLTGLVTTMGVMAALGEAADE